MAVLGGIVWATSGISYCIGRSDCIGLETSGENKKRKQLLDGRNFEFTNNGTKAFFIPLKSSAERTAVGEALKTGSLVNVDVCADGEPNGSTFTFGGKSFPGCGVVANSGPIVCVEGEFFGTIGDDAILEVPRTYGEDSVSALTAIRLVTMADSAQAGFQMSTEGILNIYDSDIYI